MHTTPKTSKTVKMHAFAIKSVLATLVLGVACATPSPGTPEPAASDNVSKIPKQYIVEYAKVSTPLSIRNVLLHGMRLILSA